MTYVGALSLVARRSSLVARPLACFIQSVTADQGGVRDKMRRDCCFKMNDSADTYHGTTTAPRCPATCQAPPTTSKHGIAVSDTEFHARRVVEVCLHGIRNGELLEMGEASTSCGRKITFGDITEDNIQHLRKMNAAIFPVRYHDKFYIDVSTANPDFTQYGECPALPCCHAMSLYVAWPVYNVQQQCTHKPSKNLANGLFENCPNMPLSRTCELGVPPVRVGPGYPAGLRERVLPVTGFGSYPKPAGFFGPGTGIPAVIFGPGTRIATCPRGQPSTRLATCPRGQYS